MFDIFNMLKKEEHKDAKQVTRETTMQIIMLIGTTESKNPNAQAEAEEIKPASAPNRQNRRPRPRRP